MKIRHAWLVGLVLACLLAVRLLFLSADPPIDLDASGGLFGDEGAYAHNARSMALFGRWITDEWNPVFYSPLMTLASFAAFRVGGVGLVQLRLLYLLLGLAGLIFVYLALVESGLKRPALWALVLLGADFILIMHHRLGLADNFLTFLLPASFYFWQKAWRRPVFWPLAGVLCFLAYVGKSTAVYFVAAMLLATLLIWLKQPRTERRGVLSGLAMFGAGFLAAAAFWFLLFYWPNREAFQAYSSQWFRLSAPRGLAGLLGNWRQPYLFWYLVRTPVLLLAGLWPVPLFVYELVRGRRRSWSAGERTVLLALLWLVGGALFIGGLNYHPLRYFVPLILPLGILGGLLIERLWAGGPVFRDKGRYFSAFYILWTGWLAALWWRYGSRRLLLAVLLLTLLGLAGMWLWAKSSFGRARPAPGARLAAVLLAMALLIGGYHWLGWAGGRRYTVIDTSRQLGQTLTDAYIAGLWAPLICLENRHRALCVGGGWFNDRETFVRYPVTHLFLWDGNRREELRFFQKDYPEVMARARELQVYTIKGLPTRLFQIAGPAY